MILVLPPAVCGLMILDKYDNRIAVIVCVLEMWF